VCWTSAGYLLGETVGQLLEVFTHAGRMTVTKLRAIKP
jgi:hypothetical protein